MTLAKINTSIVSPSKCDNTIEQCKTSCLTNEARTIVSPISDLRESPTIEKFKISIRICGIKKRCRKIEQHFFTVSYVDYNEGNFDQDAIRSLVIDFVASNVKTVCSHCIVSLDHVEQSFNGRFNCEKWLPFSDKNKSFEIAQCAF
jgi:hypothetical protein